MKRRLFTTLAAVSLLLLLATLALWLRSYFVGQEVYRLTDRRGQYLDLSRGRLTYFASKTPISRTEPRWGLLRHANADQQHRSIDSIEAHVAQRTNSGFDFLGLSFRGGLASRSLLFLAIPLWLPALLFSLPPTLYVARRLRTRHRRKGNRCPVCNYDLRASKDRCPECGTSPSAIPA